MYLQEAKNILNEISLSRLIRRTDVGIRNALTFKPLVDELKHNRAHANKWRKISKTVDEIIVPGTKPDPINPNKQISYIKDVVIPKEQVKQALNDAKLNKSAAKTMQVVNSLGAGGISALLYKRLNQPPKENPKIAKNEDKK